MKKILSISQKNQGLKHLVLINLFFWRVKQEKQKTWVLFIYIHILPYFIYVLIHNNNFAIHFFSLYIKLLANLGI